MNNATHSYTKYNTNSSSRWDHKFTLTELISLLEPRFEPMTFQLASPCLSNIFHKGSQYFGGPSRGKEI